MTEVCHVESVEVHEFNCSPVGPFVSVMTSAVECQVRPVNKLAPVQLVIL